MNGNPDGASYSPVLPMTSRPSLAALLCLSLLLLAFPSPTSACKVEELDKCVPLMLPEKVPELSSDFCVEFTKTWKAAMTCAGEAECFWE